MPFHFATLEGTDGMLPKLSTLGTWEWPQLHVISLYFDHSLSSSIPHLQRWSFQSSCDYRCFHCWEDQRPCGLLVHYFTACWLPLWLPASPGMCVACKKYYSKHVQYSPLPCAPSTPPPPSLTASLFATCRCWVHPMLRLGCMRLLLALHLVWA